MIDETLVAHVVAVAEARVALEETTRGHRLTALTAEILAGHAVQGELEAVNVERAARGVAPLGAHMRHEVLAAAMAVLATRPAINAAEVA